MSSLTDTELKELAGELDLEFLDDLRELLLSLPLRTEQSGDQPRDGDSIGFSVLAEAIYQRAKSRRLSKDRVTTYMREIDSRVSKNLGRSAPLRELIGEFVSLSAPENANRLLGLVSGRLEQDPYLAGITARR